MLRLAPISLLTFVTLTAVGVADDAPATLESALMNEGVAALAELVEKEGDAQRGAILFHQRRLACNRCHATGDGTSPLGPDLTKLKSKVTAPHIVESILLPSKKIDESFQAVQIATDEGRIVTGIVKQETSAAIELLLPLETGRVITLSRKEIDDVRTSRVSLMPAGLANQLADRGEFLDLARYVLEIAQHGPEAARRLKPDLSLLEPLDDGPVDHAQHIASLSSLDLSEGKALYSRYCVNCHGKDGNKTLNPLARRFAKDPLKFGIDPYSMYNTISYGNGLMFPQAALLSPQQRYQVVNYIRETFIRDANPTQYFEPTTEYLAAVNSRAEADAAKFGPAKIEVAAGMVDGSRAARDLGYRPRYSLRETIRAVEEDPAI